MITGVSGQKRGEIYITKFLGRSMPYSKETANRERQKESLRNLPLLLHSKDE